MVRVRPDSKKTPRRSPISREEGERRLITAATTLLQSRPFSAVSVRDLAAAADVHQSYIHTWFGSQNGLYIRVLQEISAKLVDDLDNRRTEGIPIDPNDPVARFAVRLLFWLDLEGCDLTEMKPILEILTRAHARRLIELAGIDAEVAAEISQSGVATFLGLSAFGHLLGTDPEQVHKSAMSWLKLVGTSTANSPVNENPKTGAN